MGNDRSFKLWIINVICFILLAGLIVTGLIQWWVLPRGCASAGGFLLSLRHFLRDVHEWLGLLFIGGIGVHLAYHWPYIQSNLKKYKRNK